MMDWQGPFDKLWKAYQPTYVMEFGLGEGTQWLLDHAKVVQSLEIHSNPDTIDWFSRMKEQYKDYSNWTPIFFASDGDKQLTEKMKAFIEPFLTERKWDLIFVDPGVHCRAEITNLCFGHADVIAVHDTSVGKEVYGWDKFAPTDEYEQFNVFVDEGTTFFMKKDIADKYRELPE